jgi:hypothetical protein
VGEGKVVKIMYTHVSKCKNDTSWDCFRNQGRRDEREQQRGWISNMIYMLGVLLYNLPCHQYFLINKNHLGPLLGILVYIRDKDLE